MREMSHRPSGPEHPGIHKRLQETLRRISTAEARAGRTPGGARLVAIGKTQPAAALQALVAAGQHRFGENRVQEAAGKIAELAGKDLQWHLVGHLQSNKAREAARLFDWIHSLDSVRLAEKLSAAAGTRRLQVLVQVDLSGRTGRAGVAPALLNELLEAAGTLPGLAVRGLMLLPPMTPDPQDARPFFRRLRKLARTAFDDGASVERALRTRTELKSGTRLVREWNGSTHVVDVVEGGYRWNERTYGSLSAIARAITGARWSGPRFFGVD